MTFDIDLLACDSAMRPSFRDAQLTSKLEMVSFSFHLSGSARNTLDLQHAITHQI